MDMQEMARWPRTPGPERISRAEIIISQDADQEETIFPLPYSETPWDQPHRDANMLVRVVDIMTFGYEAHEHLAHLDDIGLGLTDSGTDLMSIAVRAEDDGFLGMVINTWNNEGDDDATTEVITCLYRDPDWVGLNPYWPDCKSLHVHIFTTKPDSDEPDIVVAVPPGTELDEFSPAPVPLGELNQAIHEAAMWHGAAACSWHRNTPGKGT